MSVGKSTKPSVRKGGQTGGRETGGCSDQVCERILFEEAKFFNSRMTYSNSEKLLSPKKLGEQGGQIGGRETGGCCEQVCERIFFEVAKIFNSRMAYSNSIKLLPPKILLAEKMTLKVEIPVF